MVKKLFFKMVFACIAFVGIGSYLMYVTTGQSPLAKLKLGSLKAPKLDINEGLNNAKRAANGGTDTLYKWKDSKGRVHYSSTPPQQAISAEEIEIDPNDTNTMQALTPTQKASDTGNGTFSGSPHSPRNMKKLMDEAKNVQKLLDDRKSSQDAALKKM